MDSSVTIIDYGSGNLRSVAKAFERMATGAKIIVTADAGVLAGASHIVLPGVGAFADCIKGLSALPGMISTLEEQVFEKKKKFLGICVGMQMLFETGHEHGTHKGLGWLAGEVVSINRSLAADRRPLLKTPHMGWNELKIHKNSPLFKNIADGDHAYFVHSYMAKPADTNLILASCEYGGEVVAAIGKDNIFGTQFHPEKSGKTGLQLIENFMRL